MSGAFLGQACSSTTISHNKLSEQKASIYRQCADSQANLGERVDTSSLLNPYETLYSTPQDRGRVGVRKAGEETKGDEVTDNSFGNSRLNGTNGYIEVSNLGSDHKPVAVQMFD